MNVRDIIQQYTESEKTLRKVLKELGVGVTYNNRVYVYDSQEKAVRSYLLGKDTVIPDTPAQTTNEPKPQKIEDVVIEKKPEPQPTEELKTDKDKQKEEFMKMTSQPTLTAKQEVFDEDGWLEQEDPENIPVGLPPIESTFNSSMKKSRKMRNHDSREVRNILGI